VSSLPHAIKGWCPGALRPMLTGDGLLARVRVSGGRLSLDQAEAIADAARVCGNGVIEISSRGNLQLRGIAEAALPELQARLAALGWLDADPEVERLRNIVASPLSDIDPDAAFDVAPVVAALEARLASDAALRGLPTKFSWVVDAGGRLPLGDVDADVRFELVGKRLVVRLPPHPSPLPASGEGNLADLASPLPVLHGEGPGVGRLTSAIAHAFLALAGAGPDAPRRMRALVARGGAAAVFAAAGLAAEPARPARKISPRDVIGPLTFPDQTCLGAAPPFGRADASAFAGLVRAARRHGASGLRLTPWRALIATGLDAVHAENLAADLAALGFIVAPDDPRLGVVACPGAPACAHAHADTGAAARKLAEIIDPRGIVLHVSGCPKGCARVSKTPLTLVARPEGYDLILSGRAGDAPAHRALSLSDAAALIKTLGPAA